MPILFYWGGTALPIVQTRITSEPLLIALATVLEQTQGNAPGVSND